MASVMQVCLKHVGKHSENQSSKTTIGHSISTIRLLDDHLNNLNGFQVF